MQTQTPGFQFKMQARNQMTKHKLFHSQYLLISISIDCLNTEQRSQLLSYHQVHYTNMMPTFLTSIHLHCCQLDIIRFLTINEYLQRDEYVECKPQLRVTCHNANPYMMCPIDNADQGTTKVNTNHSALGIF